ncbi:MAG: 1-acyl-sn-glycerol-3-phosphate acyltransferase [Alphaproteobacteria bacterium]
MGGSVIVPVWVLVIVGLLAAWTAMARLLMPSVRWFFRRRVNKLIREVNTRLDIEIPNFELTKRQVLIDRLMFDPIVQETAAEVAKETNEPREAVMAQVERYAKEIVPAFNAYVYFRVGYWFAKTVANWLFRVRLGHTDEASFKKINPKSTVVFVMNHRSNMDYLLVSFLAAEKAALSYAVGEWARIWPLQQMIRSMGAYFVRRGSGNPLYRRVLERYVQMATEAGVSQAVYPEGGLTRDGLLRPPRYGLIDYMLKGFNPQGERDLVFIPVGLNYDRVIEDRTLISKLDIGAGRKGLFATLAATFGFIGHNFRLMFKGKWKKFGYACVNFGLPISMRDYVAKKRFDFREMPRARRQRAVQTLVKSLMREVGKVIPVTPVSAVAATLMIDPDRIFTEEELKGAVLRTLHDLEGAGADVYVPKGDENLAISRGLEQLRLRHLVGNEEGLYSAREGDVDLISYYANSIQHLLPAKDKAAEGLSDDKLKIRNQKKAK